MEPLIVATALNPRRKRLFWILLVLIDAGIVLAGVLVYQHWRLPEGRELNALAWQRTYSERGLEPPSGGPREGYWGDKLTPFRADTQFGPLVCDAQEPGRFDYDGMGRQRVRSDAPNARRLLIVGGSVANGAYASDIAHTYWSQLASRSAAAGHPLDITVWGAGGWTSVQEVPAMQWLVSNESFDAVLFLDGLNDLTLPVDIPLAQRLEQYLENIKNAADFLAARHIPMFVAPQPYLPSKQQQSRIERHIIKLHEFDAFHQFAFEGLLVGLHELEAAGRIHLIDCSGVFNEETATTFTDIWHFSDPGHALLAEHLASQLWLNLPR